MLVRLPCGNWWPRIRYTLPLLVKINTSVCVFATIIRLTSSSSYVVAPITPTPPRCCTRYVSIGKRFKYPLEDIVNKISVFLIKSSSEISTFDSASISVRLGSPNFLFNASKRSIIFWIWRSLFFNKSSKSLISTSKSFNSVSIFSRSRPLNVLKRISRIALVCLSSSLKFAFNSLLAASSLDELRMILTTSSILLMAMCKPFKMCWRSLSAFKSKFTRRFKTCNWWSIYICNPSLMLINFGSPFTNANMLAAKEVCNCVFLYNWFINTSGDTSRFVSITIRIPSREDSSLKSAIPLIPFSSLSLLAANSAILWINVVLLTWYGISVKIIVDLPVDSFVVYVPLARIITLPRPVRK